MAYGVQQTNHQCIWIERGKREKNLKKFKFLLPTSIVRFFYKPNNLQTRLIDSLFVSQFQALHIFGICKVLLVIRQPLIKNIPTAGWNSKHVPEPITPNGISSRIQPLETQYAMIIAMLSVVGMGVPSKYLDFPVLSLGSVATVTLNRANLVRPHSTKMVSKIWSTGVRIPIANAATAGETPNEICKAPSAIISQHGASLSLTQRITKNRAVKSSPYQIS